MSELTIPLDFCTLAVEPKVYTLNQQPYLNTVPVAYALFTEGGHYNEVTDEYEDGTYVVHQSELDITHVLMFKDFYVAQSVLKNYMDETQNTAYISGCPLESLQDSHHIRYYDSSTVIVDMTLAEYLVRIKK
jgi:hypothetical protein